MHRLAFIILLLAAVGLSGGCSGRSGDVEETVEGIPAPPLLTDPILIELNQYLNAWEVAQNAGIDKDETKAYHELEAWAEQHYYHLVQICGSGTDADLLVAAPALGFSHHEEAIHVLQRLFEHPNPDVVANAALGLGVLGSRTTPVEPVIRLLSNPDPNIRSKAAYVLSRILSTGDSRGALNPLLAALKDTESWVKVNSLNALAEVEDSRAVIPILKHCIYDHDGRVRYAAASALGSIGHMGNLIEDYPVLGPADSPMPYLIELLDDENRYIKDAAHWALRRITHEEIEPSREPWSEWYSREKLNSLLKLSDVKRRAILEQKQAELYDEQHGGN